MNQWREELAQEVFVRVYRSGSTYGAKYAQIASVFNCSEFAVKSLLFRAYESLRARLAHIAEGGDCGLS